VRFVQENRKKLKFNPKEKKKLLIKKDPFSEEFVKKFAKNIEEDTNSQVILVEEIENSLMVTELGRKIYFKFDENQKV